MSFFSKLKEGLKKTKESMVLAIEEVFNTYTKVDEAFLEELEEILIMSDVSMNTAVKISDALKETVKVRHIDDARAVREEVKRITAEILDKGEDAHSLPQSYPLIILVIGVNGVGKTTSIAKIANGLKKEGKSVLLVAADTFRAAAAEQLSAWGQRIGVNVIQHKEGSDPAAVIFDGVHSAKARGIDVVICDTAGRLHNKKNLMNELEKMNKIIDREFGEAAKETLLVIDGATGQNAKSQVKEFSEITDITGIVLTKLDGTAKGGIVISIADEFDIPVKYIGVGEGIEDMQPFVPGEFVEALFDGAERTQGEEAEEESSEKTAEETAEETAEMPIFQEALEAEAEAEAEEAEAQVEEEAEEAAEAFQEDLPEAEEEIGDFRGDFSEEEDRSKEGEKADSYQEEEVNSEREEEESRMEHDGIEETEPETEAAENQDGEQVPENQEEGEPEEPKPAEKKSFWSRLFGGN